MNKLVLSLSLAVAALTACGSAPTPPEVSALNTVQGSVQGWTSGSAVVALLTDPTREPSASNPPLASAELGSDGRFVLPLPSEEAITPYLSLAGTAEDGIIASTGCSGSLDNSDPASRAFTFDRLHAGATVLTSRTVAAGPSATTIDARLWVYETRATTLAGTVVCTETTGGLSDTMTITFDSRLKRGWNVVGLSGTVNPDTSGHLTSTLKVVTLADGPTLWYASSLAAQSSGGTPLGASAARATRLIGDLYLGGRP